MTYSPEQKAKNNQVFSECFPSLCNNKSTEIMRREREIKDRLIAIQKQFNCSWDQLWTKLHEIRSQLASDDNTNPDNITQMYLLSLDDLEKEAFPNNQPSKPQIR